MGRRYPSVHLEAGRMIVTDGPVTTAAAFSASHDLAMELIRGHAGEATARRTARVTLVPDNRTSQAPYINPVQRTPPDEFAEDVKRWLATRLGDPYDLGRLATAFHVSTRTMLRRFARACDQSPLEHLQDLRVARAKRVLEAHLLAVALASKVAAKAVNSPAKGPQKRPAAITTPPPGPARRCEDRRPEAWCR